MKVAILCPTFSHSSNVDRVVEQQAEEFVKKGHDVTIFTFESTVKPKGYKIVELGMPKGSAKQRLYRLFFFLDSKKIDQAVGMLKDYERVVSHFYPMHLIAEKAKKKFGIKFIAFNHGVGFPHLFKNPLERAYMKLFKKFYNKSIEYADDIFSVSEFLADELKAETGRDSKVAYNKVDSRKYHPGIDGSSVRKKYSIGKEPVVLFVGRLSPHKGIDLLIDAFKIVRQNRSNARLIIVGKPTFNKYHEKLKKMSGSEVIFAGFIDDDELPGYYAACDVYATASLWEGFDIPVVEAQACGKPVVAFDVCSHKEVVKNGKLVKAKDIDAFAKAILHYIDAKKN